MLRHNSAAHGGFVRSNSLRGLATESKDNGDSADSEKKHTRAITFDYDAMRVVIRPNTCYEYLLVDTASNEAAILDPGTSSSVIQLVRQEDVKLTTIFLTGLNYNWERNVLEIVAEMKSEEPTLVCKEKPDSGYRFDTVSQTIISDGDELKLGSLTIKCFHAPNHMAGHVCYYVTGPGVKHPVVFTGETLLVAGCGDFWGGSPRVMNALLNEKLASLPDDTQVFCSLERTLENLEFAKTVEPQNEDVLRKLQHLTDAGKHLLRTVPSTIGEEKKTNPFMRVAEDTVQSYFQARNVTRAMACLRQLKNDLKMKKRKSS